MVSIVALSVGALAVLLGLVLALTGRNIMEEPGKDDPNMWDFLFKLLVFGPMTRVIGWVAMAFGVIIISIGLLASAGF